MKTKISIIGAGTGTFSINLIKDICLTEGLDGSTVSLMDINEVKLDAVYRFCIRYAAEAGREFFICKTTDRKECLRGADFVINTALVGGYDRLREGWKIAKKLGYRFGGSFHVMHDEAFWINFGQLRLMEDIYADMCEVCPSAWYIVVSNPVMAAVTYLNRKHPGIKLIGMCHGYAGVYRMCDTMGIDRDKITFETSGVNHFIWMNHFYYDGRDGRPLIENWIAHKSRQYFETCPASDDFGPKTIDLYRRYGMMPIGDTCTPGGGSWAWEYHSDDEIQQRWREDPSAWYDNNFNVCGARIQSIIDAAYDEGTKLSERFPMEHSDEPMIPLIEALACDRGRLVIVNTINDMGYVPGVPRDFEVEILAWVSAEGVRGFHTKPLPAGLQSRLLRDRIATVEMELEAYETRSLERLVDLVMTDPNTHSRRQAEKLTEEILAMPGLEAMRQYYR